MSDERDDTLTGSEIAIVGMACRLPGASTVEAFWQNLTGGVESLTLLSDDDLRRAGVDPATAGSPQYVRRIPVLDDVERFDPAFFGYTRREAELMDPQHRLWLECCWEALERAGYDPFAYERSIGVFTGAKTNTYLFNLFTNREVFRSLDTFQIALGNDLAGMATRVSYKLDLRGPSYALHTACSTSLVAIHLACQSLLLDECQMALAGGAAINVPHRRGYLYQPGGILSPDGSCRTFDARAAGSNFGNGVGTVVLKRLEDALADGDHVHAVIKGSASNNDGARKASFTAPGVEGQASVILEALAAAGVDATTVSYLEAHGTATDLGDSIEMLALAEAFGASTRERGFCAIGSVKTNLGHLETAAGVAGVIKTALALELRQIPPSLHFEAPNPKIDFANSPFYVNTGLAEWQAGETPRRAGVSSFGIGSTNAHVVMEEAPEPAPSSPSRPWQLLVLSARTEAALDAATRNLAGWLRERPGLQSADFADAAWTLQAGRRRFEHRRAVVARDGGEAAAALEGLDPARVFTLAEESPERPVAFLLPGLGDHLLHMARGLYESEPGFRKRLDRSAELLAPHLDGLDLRQALYPGEAPGREGSGPDLRRLLGRGGAAEPSEAGRRLNETWLAQPALFAVEYALARMWMDWGVRPQALLGYSLGEYVAACLAGVMSLADALRLVALRARRIQELPGGAMLAVSLPEAELAALLPGYGEGLAVAAVNGPGYAVAAGPAEAIAALERDLTVRGVACRPLATTHAFHSPLLQPAFDDVVALARGIALAPPKIPYLSNLTGTWIRPEEATDPAYWARHMVGTVRFGDGAGALLADPHRVLLEVGPGQTLGSYVKLHPEGSGRVGSVLASLPSPLERQEDEPYLLATLGKLWLAGVKVDWKAYHAGERRRRVPLPTYPFERQRYWIEPGNPAEEETPGRHVTLDKQPDLADWFYVPRWEQAAPGSGTAGDGGDWLVLGEPGGLAGALAGRLREVGRLAGFASDIAGVERELRAGRKVKTVAFLWGVEPPAGPGEPWEAGFHGLIALAQALGKAGPAAPVEILAVLTGVARARGDEELVPENATLLGPGKVIPQELPRVTCRLVDVDLREAPGDLAGRLIAERALPDPGEIVALRGSERWVRGFERVRLEPAAGRSRLRDGGVYLLTGGLGGLGLALARHLATAVRARLVLTRRSPFPAREEWDGWLAGHPQDDPTSGLIRQLRGLEELGAEVLALHADAADPAQMAAVRDRALERFGALHGAVHLAGVPGGGILQLKTAEAAERILSPKLRGARVLAAALGEVPLDFLVLFSSIASVLGEFGQADYCGANAFLDALAEQRAAAGAPFTLAIDWDIWQEVGLAVHTEVPDHLKAWRAEMLEKAMLPREGVEAFTRLLSQDRPHVVVSAQDLHGRIELGRSFTGESFLLELSRAQPARPAAAAAAPVAIAALPPQGLERRLAEIWQRLLGAPAIGLNDNFFDLGGNSLVGLQLVGEINRDLGTQLTPVDLFESPTVTALARRLAPVESAPVPATRERRRRRAPAGDNAIAIIGMAGRFPGARNVRELWENLREGRETVTFFSDEELLAAGVEPGLLADPRYVKAGSVLDDVDRFDAPLFGYSPREAEVMDPQQRVFLECAWEALEDAGYDTTGWDGKVGVFAGSNLSTYLLQLYSDPEVKASVNLLQAVLGNDKDSLTTRVSYKLNLTGPSVAVQTYCSTSLVALHMACRSLLDGDCDMALAGGIRIVVPARAGYLYEEGGIAPPDGHSRSFDAKAKGSILGQGAGIVVLKRLADALADGDPVRAVVKGTAINNDGSLKAGFTAPSVDGQAEVIAAALEEAGVDPATLSYMEAHGSATELGDPIEVAALTKAFRRWTPREGFCALGSVKSNFGHLDRAAGVTGLIKTVLALEHRQLPPNLLFEEPNPKIDFARSPFVVNTRLAPWEPGPDGPRRAGINSLGMGGTNVHVVIEEAPALEPGGASRPWQLLLLSAKSEAALERRTADLAGFLAEHPEAGLADVAYTLKVGRRALEYRQAVVCRDAADAAAALADPRRRLQAYAEDGERPVAFLFPGLGGQSVGMARGLYETEAVFRRELDRCAEILRPYLEADLREILYPSGASREEGAGGVDLRRMLRREPEADPAARRLNQTRYLQPILFSVEYALARLWMEWGIRPRAMAGYSLGEYVAACLAGVLSLEDALKLVALRARRIEELPAGGMLAVALPEAAVRELLGTELSLAAVNGPEQSVVAGPLAALEALEADLAARGVSSRRLQVTHAFHSAQLAPLYDGMVELARTVTLSPPRLPYLSNVTGTWLTAEEAVDPAYWARHMCEPVRFSEAAAELLQGGAVLLEMGPQGLSSLVLQHPAAAGRPVDVVASLRHLYETQPDEAHLLTAAAKLWLAGARLDWRGFYAAERRRRIALPTYPFDRHRYWIEGLPAGTSGAVARPAAGEIAAVAPGWRRAGSPPPAPLARRWWVVLDRGGLGEELAARLGEAGAEVARVAAATTDFATLRAAGLPDAVLDLRGLDDPELSRLLALAAALAGQEEGATSVRLFVAGNQIFDVTGEEDLDPRAAALAGAARRLGAPGLAVPVLDLPAARTNGNRERLARQVLAELASAEPAPAVALRGQHRWLPVAHPAEPVAATPPAGASVVIDGLGESAAGLISGLAAEPRARLALIEPTGFPREDQWDEWLARDGGAGVVSRKIQRARGLRERGAEIGVWTADLAAADELRAALAAARERFGAIGRAVFVHEPEPAHGRDPGEGLAAALRRLEAADRAVTEAGVPAGLLAGPSGGDTAGEAAFSFALDAWAAAGGRREGTAWARVLWDLGPEAAVPAAVLGRLLALAGGASLRLGPADPAWNRFAAPAAVLAPRREGVSQYPRPNLRVEYVPPSGELEETVAAVWRDLLGVERIGVHDNFLDLGGDSLLATRLMSKMRDVLGLDLPIRLVFEASTVAELARAIEGMRAAGEEREIRDLVSQLDGLSDEEIERELLRYESGLEQG